MAKVNKYDWKIGKELPSIDDHSIVKSKEGAVRQKTSTIHDSDMITKPRKKQSRIVF